VRRRAAVGELAVTTNEYRAAERLKDDYWLYVVFDCASTPKLHAIRDPARMGWRSVVSVEHYAVDPSAVFAAGAEG